MIQKSAFSFSLAALIAASVWLLSACGGGGLSVSIADSGTFVASCQDGSTQTSAISQAAAQALCASASTSSTLVNAGVVSNTYSSSTQSEEIAAFNLLNNERANCGFGTLNQNTSLDQAAKNHADWQNINGIAGHIETAGTPGFTGVGVTDRLTAVGYGPVGVNGDADDLTSVTGVTTKSGLGIDSVRGLLNAPYHIPGMMGGYGGYRDVGIAVRTSADVGISSNTAIAQFDTAYTTTQGPQLQGASDVLTYPCQGTTGTNRQLTAEEPNPVPGRNLATSPLGGIVYVQLRVGNTLAITSASMTQVSNGALVNLLAPVAPFNTSNIGYVAANSPLNANTAYQFTLNGTNNGVAFSRTFTFTTGTGG